VFLKSTSFTGLLFLCAFLHTSALPEPLFTRVTDGPLVNDGGYSAGVCMIDYDQDGLNDFYVVNTAEGGAVNTLYRNIGNAAFEKITGLAIVENVAMGYGASWADFEGDGDLDVACCTSMTDRAALKRLPTAR
jgi:hypothetical protein